MRELVLASDWRRSRENTRLARHLVPQCGPPIKSVGVRTRENRAASPAVFEDCGAWPMLSLRRQVPRGGTLPARPPMFYLPGRSQQYGPKNQNTKITRIAKPTVVEGLEEPFPRLRQNRSSF
jgi:hypothetical protein